MAGIGTPEQKAQILASVKQMGVNFAEKYPQSNINTPSVSDNAPVLTTKADVM